MKKIKVLVVDDSKLIQTILQSVLSADDELEVVGIAEDPLVAREMIKQLNPDVLTLDVEMPRMDGITFVEKLMRLHPLPVIMFSSVTQRNSKAALEALECGAFDFVPKPSDPSQFEIFGPELIRKIKQAVAHKPAPRLSQTPATHHDVPFSFNGLRPNLIVIGASTGGIEALSNVFKNLSGSFPPILIAQHLPPSFSQTFAEHINKISPILAQIAEDGQSFEANNIYVPPAYYQMGVRRQNGKLVAHIKDNVPVGGHLPSVDYLFSSAAEINGNATMAILLTGMGKDGAQGMLAIKQKGGLTMVQDKETSTVWGMPRSALEINAADHTLSILQIPKVMEQIFRKNIGSHYG